MKTTVNTSLLIFSISTTLNAFAAEIEDYAGLPITNDTTVPAEYVSLNESGYDGLPVSTSVETERLVVVEGQFDYSGLPIMRRQSDIEIAQADAFK